MPILATSSMRTDLSSRIWKDLEEERSVFQRLRVRETR